MRFFQAALVSVVALTGMAGAAHADHNIYRDPKTGLSLSYPDDWHVVNNADPDDIMTVMAPSGRANATCRVRERDDARYAIYPSQYGRAIQHVAVSLDFWNAYLKEYDGSAIDTLQDEAGLGRGWASYIEASYWSAVEGPYMPRKALALASLYDNHLYIVECSAHRDAFTWWEASFMDIAKSIDFEKGPHETIEGNFRDFLSDNHTLFRDPQSGGVVSY